MESLLEALYIYAAENWCACLSPEDRAEQTQCENMVRRAMEELSDKGYGDQARQMRDGLSTMSWLSQRRLFRAGLSIGLDLHRL